ncbi:MAG TPA: hypothetical protein VMM85_06355 [Methylomirabilota bacterium]|nr:hypothetical protein [Methylomirabilota bacterium]
MLSIIDAVLVAALAVMLGAALIRRRVLRRAYASEAASWEEANRRLAGHSLGDMPLVLLAHGKPLPDREQEQAWPAAQAALADLSSRGELRVVPGSGHGIRMDAPEELVNSIGDVLAAAGAVAEGR